MRLIYIGFCFLIVKGGGGGKIAIFWPKNRFFEVNYEGCLSPYTPPPKGAQERVHNLNVSNSDKYLLDISLPVAMAVASYARIYMYPFISHPDVMYTDTDSIHTTKPLPDLHIGPKLGLMKLEYSGESAVFLAPKAYAVKNINDTGKDKIVLRGIKEGHNLNYYDIASVLGSAAGTNFTPIKINQERMLRSLEEGLIKIVNQEIKLMPTQNKRVIIYKDRNTIYTRPLLLEDQVIYNLTKSDIVLYNPNAYALQVHLSEYSFLDTLPYSSAQVLRNWTLLNNKYPNEMKLMSNPSLLLMDSIWLRFPNALPDPVYATHMFFFFKRWLLLLYYIVRVLDAPAIESDYDLEYVERFERETFFLIK